MEAIWWRVAINKNEIEGLVVGIDATNLRRGGGVTHLIELLTAVDPEKYGIVRVIIWGSTLTLAKLPSKTWIKKITPDALNQGLLHRTWWQLFSLSLAAYKEGCNVLFVPGGSFAGNFRPYVTMSRNLLPFELQELRRYGLSLIAIKLVLLRYIQSRSLRKADGVIFLTEYARKTVFKVTGQITGKIVTIPHGLNPRFKIKPKEQRSLRKYTVNNPCRLLYVSIVDQYKHQWNVVEAVHALRAEGIFVVLELVGPAHPPSLRRLQAEIERLDPEASWVQYRGAVPYEALHQIYAQADIGIFASSCENMPNILLETMSAGLPVACSNRGPMPEVLAETGLYFDPENPEEIANAIRKFILSAELRCNLAKASYKRSEQYSWSHTADQTFTFLAEVAREHQK